MTNITTVQLIIYALAVLSLRQLVLSDRITQFLRYRLIRTLDRAGGWLPYHIQYVIGCLACFAFWAGVMLWVFRDARYVNDAAVILAIRQLATYVASYMSDVLIADYPTDDDGQQILFPPERR